MTAKTPPESVSAYLAALSEDRRKALEAVRKMIRRAVPKQVEEGIQYGMIGYYIPHGVYPSGYHCDPSQPLPYIALASQKNYMSLYLMCLYVHPEWRNDFETAYRTTGTKLDMGASCVRFRSLDDLPLEVVEQSIRRVPLKTYIAHYEAGIGTKRGRGTKKSSK